MGMTWEGRALSAGEVEVGLEDPDAVWNLFETSSDSLAAVDLDKAWHGIHWLLTNVGGDVEGPLSQVILGGTAFADDWGYGPPRLLGAGAVASASQALEAIALRDLKTAYDAEAMTAAGLYPDIWHDGEVFKSYLAPNLVRLKAFYSYAAANACSVLQVIL